MFENLSWSSIRSFRREPALWAALIVTVANVVAQAISGDIGWGQAVEGLVAVALGFLVRGEVTPLENQ